MKHLASTGQRAFHPAIVRVLSALAFLFCLTAPAATITFPLTNSLGNAVTNAFYVTSISDPILPDGTWLQTGIRLRITPPASGAPASTNLLAGNYIVSNAFIVSQFGALPNAVGGNKGVIFAVPSGSGTYPFVSNVISGGNVYNYNGAQFVALYSNIVAALGFTPLSTNDVTQIASTNTLAAGANITLTTNAGVITVASSGGGSGSNSVSPGSLITVVTNGANYAVSAVIQTNQTVFTNDSRPMFWTNRNSFISAHTFSNTFIAFQSTNNGSYVMGTNNTLGPGILTITSPDGIQSWYFNGNNGDFGAANGNVNAQGFDGDGSLINGLNASALASGLVPMARITNLTVTNIEAASWLLATNLNDGTAAFVRAAVTNGIRAGLTNYVNAFATTNGYNPGSSIIATTNGQAVTLSISAATTNSLSTTNYTQAVSNYVVGVSNRLLSASSNIWGSLITTSNRFDPLWPTNAGSDNQVLSKTGTNTLWVTQSGGSGTGIQTNAGTGTNNVLIELSIINTNNQFGRSSSVGAGTLGGVIGGGISNIVSAGANYSTIAGGQSNNASAPFATVGGGSANNNSATAGVIAGGLGNGMGGTGNSIGGGQGNGIGSTTVGNVISGGYSNTIGNNSSYNGIFAGFLNQVGGTANNNAIIGGTSNTIGGGITRSILIGTSNSAAGIILNSIAMGTAAKANHSGVLVYSDGSQSAFTSAISNSFSISVQNGVSVNTNSANGNDLFVNGELAADTYRIRDLTNAAVNTNVIVVSGSGTVAVNGFYTYLGPQYTNAGTGATITNNAGTWAIKDASLTTIDTSSSLISTNWSLVVGSGVPRTDYGTFIYANGPLIGQFQSTNMTFQLTNYVKPVYPTNAGSDNYVLSKSGGNAYWVESVISSNTVVNIIHSNTVPGTDVLGAPGSSGTSFNASALTNLPIGLALSPRTNYSYVLTNWSTNIIHVVGAGVSAVNGNYYFKARESDGFGDFQTRWTNGVYTLIWLGPTSGQWDITNGSKSYYTSIPIVPTEVESGQGGVYETAGADGTNPCPLVYAERLYATNTTTIEPAFSRPALVAILGDSLSLGFPSLNYLTDPEGEFGGRLSWAHYLFSNYWNSLPPQSLVANLTSGGLKSADAWLAYTNIFRDVATNSSFATNFTKIAFEWSGINDITSGSNALSVFLTRSNAWKVLRQDGFRVFVFTVTHNKANPVLWGQETERYRLNDYIRASGSLYDGLIDVAAFWSPQTNSIVPNSSDDIHPNNSGAALIARYVDSVVRSGQSTPPWSASYPKSFIINTNWVVNQKYTNDFGRPIDICGGTAKGTGTGRIDINLDGTVAYSIAAASNALPIIGIDAGHWFSFQTNGTGNPTLTGGQAILR